MPLKKQKLKDIEIAGHPAYILEDGTFFCQISDVEFRERTLDLLRLRVEEKGVKEINTEAYYADSLGAIERVLVVRLDTFRKDQALVTDVNGRGGRTRELRELFPITPENTKIYEEHKRIRAEGWELIHKADAMGQQLVPFSEDFWKNKKQGGL